MTLAECVQTLFQRNSTHLFADQAFNQAASLHALSEDLYSDPMRFVYELIQNADDAQSKQIHLVLLDENYFLFTHDGRAFDERDVRSLCAVSRSTKVRQKETVGYKGLGFKAVFGQSDYVLVMSNGQLFRFDKRYEFSWTWNDIDKTTWETQNEQKFIYPWQICPIWTEKKDIPKVVATWMKKNQEPMPVAIVIRFPNIEKIRVALQELSSLPETFLFLRHIRQVKFQGILEHSSIGIVEGVDESLTLYYGKNQCSRWLLTRREVQVPSEVLLDTRLPEKLREASTTEIGLAAQIDPTHGNNFLPLTNNSSLLFSYIPTRISTYNLPLLVNANFLTNANREQIHTDSTWNQYLFKAIPRETIEWVKVLSRKPMWSSAAYDLLPKITRGTDSLAKAYDNSCSDAMDSMAFIRTTKGDYITFSQAVIDLTDLSNQLFMGPGPIREFIMGFYGIPLPPHPFVSENQRLRDLDVVTFDWKDAIHMFGSPRFQHRFSPSQNLQLIFYLHQRKEEEEILVVLHQLPFLMDRSKQLHVSTGIYFPSEFDQQVWRTPDCPDGFVHEEVMKGLQAPQREWLAQLGVTVKTDLTFVHRTIIPNARRFINPQNAIDTIRRLSLLFANGQITAHDVQSLGELALLTEANTLQPACRLYLALPYGPVQALQSFLIDFPELFVSSSYLQNSPHHPWKPFFLAQGVQERIDLTTLTNDCALLLNYNHDQASIIFNLGSQRVHGYKNHITIRLLEYTENDFTFASFFWDYVIKHLNVHLLNEDQVAYWGAENRPGATEGSKVNNYPKWFVRTRPCVPAVIKSSQGHEEQRCFRGPDVFIGRLSPLIGHHLPVSQFQANTEALNDQWARFFQFRTELTIDEHLFILHQVYLQNQTTLSNEDDRRIQDIYGSLLQILYKINANQRVQHQKKCQSMALCFLIERNNRFLPPEELLFWSLDTLPSPTSLNLIKVNFLYRQHPNLLHLLYIFNVKPLTMDDLNVEPINPTPCEELTDRLPSVHLLSLIHLENLNQVSFPDFQAMNYFEADRLDLRITDLNTFVGHTQVHVQDNTLYVIRPWNSPSVASELARKLCELLQLPFTAFERHIRGLLTMSADDYFIHLGILPAEDPLPPPITSDQMIERANEELLRKFDHLSTEPSPAHLFLTCLEAQESSWKGSIYYYTHLEEAIAILCHTDVQPCRFCFHPRTSLQRASENLGTSNQIHPVPVYFCIKLRDVFNLPGVRWRVKSSHCLQHDSPWETIKKFDFTRLDRDDQSEFLVDQPFALTQLPKDAVSVVFQNVDAKESFECLMKEHEALMYPCHINKDYFFNTNNQIHINHQSDQDYIAVQIDCRDKRSPVRGMIIVQLRSPADALACNGDLLGVFHGNHLTTIYGKEKLFTVHVGQQPYTVYYEEEGQRWLIYTNDHRAQFDTGHLEQSRQLIPSIHD